MRQLSAGRPRSFDPDVVLDTAIEVFWRHGLSGTTYSHLEEATGLHRQSLVYAFGDKAGLFGAALRRYARHKVDRVVAELARHDRPASQGIAAACAVWMADAAADTSSGCLLVNTAGELGRSSDPAIAQVVDEATRELLDAFADAFARALHAGDLPAGSDPTALAHLVVAAGDGALLRSRAADDPSFTRTALSALLSLLSCGPVPDDAATAPRG